MKNFILFIWSLLFNRWEVEILKRGTETWKSVSLITLLDDYSYQRDYVEYKYKHKFFKKEKIVKEYLN